ncbi:hypothetical protein UB46_39720 [Burkholderiaceae bacterium 16]|nr:hypothetical protein UB46_39720 [Burkholderiaceae bacterium 16]
MPRLRSIMLAAVVGAALGAASFGASAQEYPTKLVRVLSPYATGLSPDVATRILAEKLGNIWGGKPVVIESRPGANGVLAISAEKKSVPNGYSLLVMGHSHLTINPVLLRNLPYDPVKDFVPLALIYRAPFFVCVSGDSPYKTVGDLIKAAKASPGKLSYATSYIGSPSHFATATLALMTGTQLLPVHYATEGLQAYNSVVNGDITFTLASAGSVAPLVKSGRLRMIATTSPTRLPNYPDIPTIGESGGPANYEFETWAALVAPTGTPPDVVRRISADTARALAAPDLQEHFRSLGFEPARDRTSADISNLVREDLKRNQELIKRLGISVQ